MLDKNSDDFLLFREFQNSHFSEQISSIENAPPKSIQVSRLTVSDKLFMTINRNTSQQLISKIVFLNVWTRIISWPFHIADYVEKCHTSYKEKCHTVYHTVYDTKYEKKCKTDYEKKCHTGMVANNVIISSLQLRF